MVASCSNVRAEQRSRVVASGSFGGRFNAFNAARWPVSAVIMDVLPRRYLAGRVGMKLEEFVTVSIAAARRQPRLQVCSGRLLLTD
jgi:hypothetical protein